MATIQSQCEKCKTKIWITKEGGFSIKGKKGFSFQELILQGFKDAGLDPICNPCREMMGMMRERNIRSILMPKVKK